MLTLDQRICARCGVVAYSPIWIDTFPPGGRCPNGETGPDMVPCTEVLAQAKAERERRRFCPEAFDANGRIKPGGLAVVIRKVFAPLKAANDG